jgi:Domain of unknown function (DUF1905)
MTKPSIRFKAKLCRPAQSEKGEAWTFLILPKDASAKLPSRGVTPIEGTLNGFPFQATLEPDGQKSHWLKVDRKLSKSASAEAGDMVTLEITPAGKGHGTRGANRSAQGSRGRPESARVIVRHHAQCAPGLDPLDYLPQTRRDARAPDQKCVLDAHCREAPRLLLRPVRVLQ